MPVAVQWGLGIPLFGYSLPLLGPNFVQRSLICEDCALILESFLDFDFACGLFSSALTSTADVLAVLVDILPPDHWRVPRALASSFLNCMKDI